MSHSPGPRLLAEVSFGVATCPSAPKLASLQRTEMRPPRGSSTMLTKNNCPSSPWSAVEPCAIRIRNALLYEILAECHLCSAEKWLRSITVDPVKLQPVSGQNTEHVDTLSHGFPSHSRLSFQCIQKCHSSKEL
jgi:hypothetical protein